MTSDIDGAKAGYLMEHQLSLPASMRKEFRNNNFLGDIEGAQADTRKKTIQTKRCSNPLQPVYQSLDGDELVSGPVESLIPPQFIDKNTTNYKSYGVIPQQKTNQWNSSHQSKECLTHSRSTNNSRNNSSAQILVINQQNNNHNSSSSNNNNTNNTNNNIDADTDDIKFTYSFGNNQSTTSQYLYPSSSSKSSHQNLRREEYNNNNNNNNYNYHYHNNEDEDVGMENLKSYADKLKNDLLIPNFNLAANQESKESSQSKLNILFLKKHFYYF